MTDGSSFAMYSARPIATVDNGPGRWQYMRVGVFRTVDGAEEQVGEYSRNYPSLFNTFCPFHLQGNDYALYSTNYTATRVMALPSCHDIGGEEVHTAGFCPTDYFVPTFVDLETTDSDGKVFRFRKNKVTEEDTQPRSSSTTHRNPRTGETKAIERQTRALTPLTYYPFGFVAGCIWGDDSTWKIQYLDLSEVERGIIKRDDRFGYIELPDKAERLADVIDMSDYMCEPGSGDYHCIRITIQQKFDLQTGERAPP